MITDHILSFLRIGVMRNEFSSKPVEAPIFYRPAPQFDRRITSILNGWQLGVGAQNNMYKNLDGRVEYVFTNFNGIDGSKRRGNVNQVTVGAVYKFTNVFHKKS